MTSYFRLRVLVLPYIALTLACFTHGFQHQNAFTVRQFPQAVTRTGSSLSHANTNLQQPLRRKFDVINKKPVIYLHQSASASLDGKESSVTPSILSQVFSHRNASILYFLTSIILANPVSMVEGSSAFKLMSMQPGQYNAAKVGGVMGFFMASSISYMLHKFQQKDVEAGENDDVNVDANIDAPNQSMNEATLRKLNFGLMMFAFIGLFAVPGESAMLSNSANAVAGNSVMTTAVLAFIMQHFTRAIGLVAAFRGWVATNGIFTPQQPSGQFRFLNELAKGSKQTWIDGKKRKKTIYSTVFAFSLLGMVNNFMSFQHVAKSTAISIFHKSLNLTAIARLSLISAIASVLHDAASRNELDFEPYKKFKYLLGAWAISVGVSRGLIDSSLVSLILQKTVTLLVFAWPIMYKSNAATEEEEGV